MKLKLWTLQQLPLVKQMEADHMIPEIVADELENVLSILDRYYGADRAVETADGGYILLYTHYIARPEKIQIQDVLDTYYLRPDEMEAEDILCVCGSVTWKSVLYLATNDYGITLIYPVQGERQ